MKKLHNLKIFTLLLLIVIIVAVTYLSFCQIPYAITIEQYEVSSSTLPDEFKNFKIGYFSDLDLSDEKDIVRLEKIVTKINNQNFDLVVFGGDLYEEQFFQSEEVGQLLQTIKAKYGKFAVLGEKDYISVNDTKSLLQLSGFEVLSNEDRTIYYNNSAIMLLGLESTDNLNTLVNESNIGAYKIAVVHQPDFFVNSINKQINLQLSGHSHGGYVYIPFLGPLITVEGAKTYNHGRYDIDQSTLIVSNGLGMERDQSARFLCTPDITQVTLTK